MQQKTNNNATYTENKLLDHNYHIPDLVQDILRKKKIVGCTWFCGYVNLALYENVKYCASLMDLF